jgi:hypothetical protein
MEASRKSKSFNISVSANANSTLTNGGGNRASRSRLIQGKNALRRAAIDSLEPRRLMTKTVIWDTEIFTGSNLNESDWYTSAQGGGVLLNDSVAGTPSSVVLVGGYHPASGWDSDWFGITPQKTDQVTLTRGSDTVGRPYIDILQTPTGSGTVIANITQNQTYTSTFNVTAGVLFYIRIGGDANSAGNYTVNLRFTTATATTESDPTIYDVESQYNQWSGGNLSNNSTSNAQGVVSLGNYNNSDQPLTISGDAHTAGGEDWYVFRIEDTGDYEAIRIASTTSSSIEIRDGTNASTLKATVPSALNSAVTFTLTAGQLVYAKVQGTSGAYNGYTLQLRKKAGTTPPAVSGYDKLAKGTAIARMFWIPEQEAGNGVNQEEADIYSGPNNARVYSYNPLGTSTTPGYLNQSMILDMKNRGLSHIKLYVGPEFLLREVARPASIDRNDYVRVTNQVKGMVTTSPLTYANVNGGPPALYEKWFQYQVDPAKFTKIAQVAKYITDQGMSVVFSIYGMPEIVEYGPYAYASDQESYFEPGNPSAESSGWVKSKVYDQDSGRRQDRVALFAGLLYSVSRAFSTPTGANYNVGSGNYTSVQQFSSDQVFITLMNEPIWQTRHQSEGFSLNGQVAVRTQGMPDNQLLFTGTGVWKGKFYENRFEVAAGNTSQYSTNPQDANFATSNPFNFEGTAAGRAKAREEWYAVEAQWINNIKQGDADARGIARDNSSRWIISYGNSVKFKSGLPSILGTTTAVSSRNVTTGGFQDVGGQYDDDMIPATSTSSGRNGNTVSANTNLVYEAHPYSPYQFVHQGTGAGGEYDRMHDLPYVSSNGTLATRIATLKAAYQNYTNSSDWTWNPTYAAGSLSSVHARLDAYRNSWVGTKNYLQYGETTVNTNPDLTGGGGIWGLAHWADRNGTRIYVGEFGQVGDFAPRNQPGLGDGGSNFGALKNDRQLFFQDNRLLMEQPGKRNNGTNLPGMGWAVWALDDPIWFGLGQGTDVTLTQPETLKHKDWYDAKSYRVLLNSSGTISIDNSIANILFS